MLSLSFLSLVKACAERLIKQYVQADCKQKKKHEQTTLALLCILSILFCG